MTACNARWGTTVNITPAIGKTRLWPAALAGALLLAWLGLVMAPIAREGPTVDEPAHIARGLAFWRTGQHDLYIGHPYLVNALTTWLTALDSRVTLPLDHPAWLTRDWVMFHDVTFWKSGNDPMRLVQVSRWLVVLLSVVLGAVIYRLGADVGGAWAGVAALGLAVLDPSLRAHSRLVTTDLGVTLFWTLSLWLWWRWWRHPTGRRAVMLGGALALALASKFTATIFMPPLLLLTLWMLRAHPQARLAWRTGAVALAVTGLGVWALYGFEARPVLGWPWPVPLASYWEEFHWSVTSLENAPAYLLGEVSRAGFWSFFAVALAVKLPLPLGALSLIPALTARRLWRAYVWLWGPAVFYGLVAVVMRINIGYRHLMPVWPVIYVAGGWGALWLWRRATRRGWARLALAALTLWLGVNTAQVYPYDLTFFNEVGQALGGPYVLQDSNFDWGQDLLALADYVRRHDPEPLYVSYFGAVQLHHFGIFTRLAPPLPAPAWNPALPPPGWYAISATYLYGAAVLDNPDTFAYFRQQTPVTVLGRTIYLYQVKPHPPGTLVACVQPAPWWSEAEARSLFRDTLKRFVPVNCEQGLPLPAGPTWYYLRSSAQQAAVADTLNVLGATRVFAEAHQPPDRARALYFVDDPAARLARWPGQRVSARVFAGCAEWQGHRLAVPPRQARPAIMETLWRFSATPAQPMSVSLQLINAEGQQVAGDDGLAVPFDRLRAGDWALQRHRLDFSSRLPDGAQWRVSAYQLPLGQPLAPCRLPDGALAAWFTP